ncbi:septal ring lytic transglycosylase RlpA family protein [Labrenzia suaedae]|uniref:Endolytic peptidoglycan transglycosylase RlpA n=2 Tax=Roseibium litorale TaxID=2803841 RepID=A0ABR9CJL4_9HYPH|nr:septal ring lytic transglycosylase RlpA family protein [Roseibium litorale]
MLRTVSCVIVAGGIVAACGTTQQSTSKFSPKKYGVKGSPRIVADGQPVPKGGGRSIVGKKYKVAGKWYYPKEDPDYEAVGLASWYGPTFHGRQTANGEVFDKRAISAAHTTMPLPSYARVTNMSNGRSMIVRVNDRGPFHGNRVIDLSERAANLLGTKAAGVAKVKVEYVGPARMDGRDEQYLLASLSGPGSVAPGATMPGTMLAQATPPAPLDNTPVLSYGATAPAPAPRPYLTALTQVASAAPAAPAYSASASYDIAYDPAIAFEATATNVQVASANTFSQPVISTGSPVVETIPAAYVEPMAPASGTLGVLRVPAGGQMSSLVSGSAVSSYRADSRISAAHEAAASFSSGSIPLAQLVKLQQGS